VPGTTAAPTAFGNSRKAGRCAHEYYPQLSVHPVNMAVCHSRRLTKYSGNSIKNANVR
jgi:hypothetical protein